jgi:hypothetical protein
MTHFYEKNIVEIKEEYTTFLINIMTPFIYEGLQAVYNFALETDKKLKERARHDPNTINPGIFKIFQSALREIPTLNNHAIEKQTERIKDKTRCSDWFDDLIKAVVKSSIVLLTFSTDAAQSDLINQKYHERIESKDFVHKCLIEGARAIYNNPELFYHEYPPLERKRNQRDICEIIGISIKNAIRKMLPMKLILQEYLKNEYVKEEYVDVSKRVTESEFMNIKAMVQRDLKGHPKYPTNYGRYGDDSLLEDDYDGNQEKMRNIRTRSDGVNNEFSDQSRESLSRLGSRPRSNLSISRSIESLLDDDDNLNNFESIYENGSRSSRSVGPLGESELGSIGSDFSANMRNLGNIADVNVVENMVNNDQNNNQNDEMLKEMMDLQKEIKDIESKHYSNNSAGQTNAQQPSQPLQQQPSQPQQPQQPQTQPQTQSFNLLQPLNQPLNMQNVTNLLNPSNVTNVIDQVNQNDSLSKAKEEIGKEITKYFDGDANASEKSLKLQNSINETRTDDDRSIFFAKYNK